MFDHTDILILSLILVVAAPLQKCKDFPSEMAKRSEILRDDFP